MDSQRKQAEAAVIGDNRPEIPVEEDTMNFVGHPAPPDPTTEPQAGGEGESPLPPKVDTAVLAMLAKATARKLADHRLVKSTTEERYSEVVADFTATILEALKTPRASEFAECWRHIVESKLSCAPPGTKWLTHAFLSKGGQIVINGDAPSGDGDADDPSQHNCDAMGCSSVWHVVARMPHDSALAGEPHGETLESLAASPRGRGKGDEHEP